MERVVERGNVKAALKRVRQNKGSPGVDGMTVDELPQHLMENWGAIRAQLLDGTYQPKPVREVEIPWRYRRAEVESESLGFHRCSIGFSSRAFWWKNSSKLLNVALPTSYYDQEGVPRLAA